MTRWDLVLDRTVPESERVIVRITQQEFERGLGVGDFYYIGEPQYVGTIPLRVGLEINYDAMRYTHT